ncbi:hypothetical protein [Paracoccus thiocyanatus]|nr:hypothetical protein [Paracoccus thiocyanatus]
MPRPEIVLTPKTDPALLQRGGRRSKCWARPSSTVVPDLTGKL